MSIRFGLTVSPKKTEIVCQSYPPHQTASASITTGALKSVDQFESKLKTAPTFLRV